MGLSENASKRTHPVTGEPTTVSNTGDVVVSRGRSFRVARVDGREASGQNGKLGLDTPSSSEEQVQIKELMGDQIPPLGTYNMPNGRILHATHNDYNGNGRPSRGFSR
jgi:hypothetical protein